MLWIWWCLLFLSLNIFICYCWEFDRWRQKKIVFRSGQKWESEEYEKMLTHPHIVLKYMFIYFLFQFCCYLCLWPGISLSLALSWYNNRKKWIGYFSCEFIRCIVAAKVFMHHYYCYYLLARNTLLFLPIFFFLLPFFCLFTFRFFSIVHFPHSFVKWTNTVNYDGNFQMTKIFFMECICAHSHELYKS